MELCSTKEFKTKIIIMKIKEKQKQKGIINLKEPKINLNDTKKIKVIINNSNERNSKFIHYNDINKIKNTHNINNLRKEENSSINKCLKKKYSNLKYIFNKKDKFLNFIIFLLIKLLFILSQCKQEKLLYKFSEVSLQIKETGNINIISKDYFKRYKPYEIIINGSNANEIKYKYYFNDSGSFEVNIKWNIIIEDTFKMFQNCYNITKIDLTKFETSQITNTSYMFYGCSSLNSIVLSNFDSSKVKYMR